MNDIKVSVICLTYNHEKYIRKCLEGFVNQKTDFNFEVIIHDDASTDNTVKIIREYEKEYPNLIKPIYQKENQYSKLIPISKTYVWPKAKGKYFALCEGDDYWIDNNKLQKQFDFMEENPEYSICVHNSWRHLVKTNENIPFPNVLQDRDYSTEEVILGDGGLFSTNSIFAKRFVIENRPKCFQAKTFSDYQIVVYGSIVGKLRCFSDIMSVYNSGVENSWSERTTKDPKKYNEYCIEMVDLLNSIDRYYKNKYHKAIIRHKEKYERNIWENIIVNKDYSEMIKTKWKPYFRKESPLKERIYIIIKVKCKILSKLI